MLISLDPSSTAPLYEQVAGAIRRAIAAGELVGDDELPAARTLASALGINVHTVLRAYGQLRDEGIITLRQGRSARVVGGTAAETALFHQALGAVAAHGRRLGIGPAEASEILAKAYQL
ncbi:GntR family transcriptional regulator [Actinomycetota bacterium]